MPKWLIPSPYFGRDPAATLAGRKYPVETALGFA